MAAFLDGCRFNPTAGGTTDWTYSSAVTGYQSPAAAGVVNGTLYKYRAESADLSQWELGQGAYNTSTGVLARTTVLFNSSATGAASGQSGAGTKINFSTTPQVAIVALKEDLIAVEEANSFTDTQKAQARTNVYAAPFDALAFNGMQVNGSMDVDQVNAGSLISAVNGYAIDGSIQVLKSGSMVLASQQVADAPAGLVNSLKVTVTTAEASIAAADYAIIRMPIEGYRVARLAFGSASAQPVSIGFWTKINRTGTYSGVIRNSAANRTYAFTFAQAVSSTWQFNTITVPGDTTGTWSKVNASGLEIILAIASGSSNAGSASVWSASNILAVTGTTNGVAATTDVFQITGLIVLPGIELPGSTHAPFLLRPYDEELTISKRYWETGNCVLDCAVNATTTVKQTQFMIPVEKRVTPTITTSGTTGSPTVSASNQRAISAFSTATTTFMGFTWFADARM